MCIRAVEDWPGRDRIEMKHDSGAWHQWLVSEYQWQESFRRISAVLPALTKKELDIIGDVATEFVKNSASDRDIRPLNEQELWARIDHSIEQADRGEVLTLEETMESIDQEFEL